MPHTHHHQGMPTAPADSLSAVDAVGDALAATVVGGEKNRHADAAALLAAVPLKKKSPLPPLERPVSSFHGMEGVVGAGGKSNAGHVQEGAVSTHAPNRQPPPPPPPKKRFFQDKRQQQKITRHRSSSSTHPRPPPPGNNPAALAAASPPSPPPAPPPPPSGHVPDASSASAISTTATTTKTTTEERRRGLSAAHSHASPPAAANSQAGLPPTTVGGGTQRDHAEPVNGRRGTVAQAVNEILETPTNRVPERYRLDDDQLHRFDADVALASLVSAAGTSLPAAGIPANENHIVEIFEGETDSNKNNHKARADATEAANAVFKHRPFPSRASEPTAPIPHSVQATEISPHQNGTKQPIVPPKSVHNPSRSASKSSLKLRRSRQQSVATASSVAENIPSRDEANSLHSRKSIVTFGGAEIQHFDIVSPFSDNGAVQPTPLPYPSTQLHVDTTLKSESTVVELPNDASRPTQSDDVLDQDLSAALGKELAKRRKTSLFTVIVEDGKFVMDVPVSKRTLMHATHDGSGQNGEEFTHLRYTAVTCKAQEFNQEKYTLRAKNFGRKIRIAIVITMYNENDKLFCRTFRGVMKNIAFLCSGECAFWDRDSWKEIVVVIVADGRAKIHPSVLTVWGVQGLFMEGIEKSSVNGKQVLAHMFEFSTQLSIDKNLRIQENVCDDSDHLSLVPCQTILLIKSKNAKKINSHRWFFELCKVLSPEMCVLLDVGTKPRKRSLFHLSEAFRTNGKVGGACGEIVAQLGRYGTKLFNPLVAVQNFEYKISNVLDKPLESVFGYISVLPGAFSAYRYEAILGQPLEKYFKGDHSEGAPEQVSVQEANMYLAEDRILCFEVVMKADKNWILKYVKSAVAETDVPRTLDELIAQRRRWLNGSFFAAIHATLNMSRIFKSRHTMFRKWMLVVVFVYNVVNLLFTWCGLGHFYLAFYFLFDVSQSAGCTSTGSSTVDPFYPSGQAVFTFLNDSYILAIVIIFVLSLGNRPQANPLLYTAISAIFAIIMFFILFISIWTIRASLQAYYAQNSLVPTGFWAYATSDSSFRDIVLSVMVTYGLYLLSSTIHLQLGHILICGIPYLLMTPTFTNILNVYAFCNLHDISWGTKGDNTVSAAPAVVTQRSEGGQNVAVVEIPFEAEDVDEQWMGMYEKLNQESKGLESRKEVTKIDPKTKQDDFYKNFRTKVLLCWVITNYMIIFVFTNDDIVNAMFPNRSSGTNLNPYFTFLLWSVTLLSCIKFTFSAVYLIGWHVDGLRQGGKRNIAAKFIKKTDSGGSF